MSTTVVLKTIFMVCG